MCVHILNRCHLYIYIYIISRLWRCDEWINVTGDLTWHACGVILILVFVYEVLRFSDVFRLVWCLYICMCNYLFIFTVAFHSHKARCWWHDVMEQHVYCYYLFDGIITITIVFVTYFFFLFSVVDVRL